MTTNPPALLVARLAKQDTKATKQRLEQEIALAGSRYNAPHRQSPALASAESKDSNGKVTEGSGQEIAEAFHALAGTL